MEVGARMLAERLVAVGMAASMASSMKIV